MKEFRKSEVFNNVNTQTNITIHSRKSISELINKDFPENTAVISFYGPDDTPVDYKDKAVRIIQIPIHDLDLSVLPKYSLTYETYFPEASALAEFIIKAHNDKNNIICQCDYGESRSAGCAAAILEFYEHRGIEIFADYRYYPNQVIYHKVYDALILC